MCTAVAALAFLLSCSRPADSAPVVVEKAQPAPTFVEVDLQPLPGDHGAQVWLATYNAAGKTAKFRMDFGAAESTPNGKSGEGTVIPQAGSDSSALLADLQKVLQAKTAPVAPPTKTSVPFTYILQGSDSAMKLIFGDGDKQSEILMNIDSAAKKAKFSMKDPRYGDLALAELAKAL